jgi:AcrR family transcriptional regulator
MSTVTTTRHTAQERREEILQAAVVRFGATGLHGTSTELIAADVGLSQPYLFRLFGTKKDLFMAAIEWAFDDTVARFREAARGATDRHDAFRRMGDAYMELVRDRRYLAIQLQAYAATDDPQVLAVVREGFGRLVQEIVRHTQADPAELAAYLGRGMLLNVAGAMDLLGAESGWAAMVREGCFTVLDDPPD